MTQACELCTHDGGEILWRNERLRVVLVDDGQYPGFCRIIWNAHVREMTDLSPAERDYLMQTVWQVEAGVRAVMQPDKINLASLGNVVPHLHWHVIPRYRDDAHFPAPIWVAKQREPDAAMLAVRRSKLPALQAELQRIVTEGPPS